MRTLQQLSGGGGNNRFFAAEDTSGGGPGPDQPRKKKRLDNKGTVGSASEPSERNDATLREQNLDPTLGSEGGIGQSIGSGQKKKPSSGFGPDKGELEKEMD